MPLTETAIKHAGARAHTYRLSDGRGLTLLVQNNGAKIWRFRYQFDGREGNLSLGQYPDTTLALARDKRDEARKHLAAGINPSERRKEEKARRGNTFKIAPADYLSQCTQPQGARAPLSEATMSKAEWMLESFVYPHIGSDPIANIKADTVRRLLLRIEADGFNETVRRTKQLISRVFRYAVAHGLVAPGLDHLVWLGDVPITHVSSAHADGLRYRAEVDERRRARSSAARTRLIQRTIPRRATRESFDDRQEPAHL